MIDLSKKTSKELIKLLDNVKVSDLDFNEKTALTRTNLAQTLAICIKSTEDDCGGDGFSAWSSFRGFAQQDMT